MTASTTLTVRFSNAADYRTVRDLLSSAHLPTEDLDSAPGLHFWVAEDEGHIVGAIGLESFGPAALLRSLIVAPSYRGHGLGSTLIATLEREARSHFAEVLVLLTETAEVFFRRHGFEVIEREYLPDEVKRSAEFQSLCPASAVCMTKLLPSLPTRVLHE
jgi:amino-acid N-acetyltransferase